jgi:hypothetical protein
MVSVTPTEMRVCAPTGPLDKSQAHTAKSTAPFAVFVIVFLRETDEMLRDHLQQGVFLSSGKDRVVDTRKASGLIVTERRIAATIPIG